MLTRINETAAVSGTPIAQCAFPSPFGAGLEYAAPARGCWNIVHTGMLVPQAHEIFVCAASCLRGVVLTAAEMNAQHRFSTVEVKEQNLLDGDLEELIVEGVSDVLARLPYRPPAVLVYTNCIHHFAGCDLDLAYRELRSRFPDIDFTDCYMNPIMRKSGLTPDQLVRKGMCDLLKPQPTDPRSVMLLNCDQPTMPDSDLTVWLKQAGFTVYENTACRTYAEYQAMARAGFYLCYNPAYIPAARGMEIRLGGRLCALSTGFGYDEIDGSFAQIAAALGIPPPVSRRDECDAALAQVKALLGDTPIAIDYTCCARPMSMARLLLEHGLNVRRIYIDTVSTADKADFGVLQTRYPQVLLYPTVHPRMRFGVDRDAGNFLAIGQKAAYFTNTNRFVDLVSGGGALGYQAILHLAEQLRFAYQNEQDMRKLIQRKGKGCESCL